MRKHCYKCSQDLPYSEFYKHKTNNDGLSTACKKCHNRLTKERRIQNPTRARSERLKRGYGLTLEQYNAMFSKQEGRCFICSVHQSQLKKSLAVDHDHETGAIRGLLCPKCNKAIGLLKDSFSLVQKAADYLKFHNNKIL